MKSPQVIALDSKISLDRSGDPSLSFDNVVTDSRCPANAVCVWAGIAVARFTFRHEGREYPFMLSLMPGQPKQDTIIKGYFIEFFELNPYPGIYSDTKAPGVTAEVKVHKL